MDDLLGYRRGDGVTSFVIIVIAGAGLLAAAVHFAQHVANRFTLGLLLYPANVEPGEIAHSERAHRKAEVVEHPVDVPGHGALENQLLGFALALEEHAVADESGGDAGQNGDLADLLGQLHRGSDDVLAGMVGADDLQELHDIGGREEVQSDHRFWSPGHRGDFVDVQRRGVGGQDRARFTDGVELFENVLLDVHALEHRLDHQIDVGEGVHVQRPGDQAGALLDLFGSDAAALGGALVVLADGG